MCLADRTGTVATLSATEFTRFGSDPPATDRKPRKQAGCCAGKAQRRRIKPVARYKGDLLIVGNY